MRSIERIASTMAPCTDAIAESLTRELAKGLVGSNLPLSELQKELGVPHPLVFIAGLVLLGEQTTAPPFTTTQSQQFEHLQRQYHTCLNLELTRNVFQLSATLIPCREARNVITECINAHERKMTLQANAAAESLLQETKKTAKKKKKKKKKQQKKNKSNLQQEKTVETMEKSLPVAESKKEPPASLDTDSESSEEEEEDQPQVLTPICQVKNQTDVISSSSEPWVQVKTKRSLRSQALSDADDSKNHEEQVSNETATATSNHADENRKEESFEDIAAPPSCSIPTDELSKECTIQSLQEQVECLKLALAERETLLQQERQSHLRKMQRQRESTEERIQALQLRLYISETRSRNYEEALEAHVQAVANNVALTPRKSKRGTDRDDENSTEDGSSSSKPLYSRVAATK